MRWDPSENYEKIEMQQEYTSFGQYFLHWVEEVIAS